MSSLRETLIRALHDLDELGLEYAVIGGLAVSVRTEPRTTRDVDVAVVAANDTDAERALFAMQARGYTIGAVVEQTATGRLATARLTPSTEDGVVLDLLFASSGVEPELVAASERLEVLRGTYARVATVGHLIALKLLARAPDRPQDEGDLRRLAEIATSADLAMTRAAIQLITARGYARGRDLGAALEALLASAKR